MFIHVHNVQVCICIDICVLTYMQINVCENVCTGTHTYIFTFNIDTCMHKITYT